MLTYDDILLMAGELVAVAEGEQINKELAMELCLHAGKLRGLVAGGEPINSEYMTGEINFAHDLYAIGRRRIDSVPV